MSIPQAITNIQWSPDLSAWAGNAARPFVSHRSSSTRGAVPDVWDLSRGGPFIGGFNLARHPWRRCGVAWRCWPAVGYYVPVAEGRVTPRGYVTMFCSQPEMMYNMMYSIYCSKRMGGNSVVTKVRKQVYIEPHQDVLLKRLAKERGTTEAEVIRRAIDQHTRLLHFPRRDLAAWEDERTFIIHLIQQGAVPGKRTWRREDLHER